MERKYCAFCDIVNEGSRLFIFQSDNTATIHSNPYQVEGHLLVIPKNHYQTLHGAPRDLLHEIVDEIVKAEKLLLNKGAEGITIKQNYFPFLPESEVKVDHLHFHVIPRYP